MYVNCFQCCGNLVADPEPKDHKGNPFAKFTIALNKPKQEKPMYLDCVAWGNIGSGIVDYCRKGQEVYLNGELVIGSYTDREGVKRKSIALKVKEFSVGRTAFLEDKPETVTVPKPRHPWVGQSRE